MMNCCCCMSEEEDVECSQRRICEAVANSYGGDHYMQMQSVAEKVGIKDKEKRVFRQEKIPQENENPSANAPPLLQSDFFKEEDDAYKFEKSGGEQHSTSEADGCELSLSLSLHHPSFQRSNNVSSTSEISEAISSYSRSDSSQQLHQLNLDLSIALCGA
ncbi:hypothetical protein Salat_1915400 [Sesamum alatum]|uniref:Uncharacterized protein n=1 Tax=Sesamum alatum TaxID=300844 RepID=A0AAE1Y3X3_9LAMI|nr:hypothetical protein Salat_1915400 [Sesamum alatum]